MAAEVLDSGEAQALEPMSAADRKIVHDTVNAIEGVSTTSEGVDPRRYVVAAPRGSRRGRATLLVKPNPLTPLRHADVADRLRDWWSNSSLVMKLTLPRSL